MKNLRVIRYVLVLVAACAGDVRADGQDANWSWMYSMVPEAPAPKKAAPVVVSEPVIVNKPAVVSQPVIYTQPAAASQPAIASNSVVQARMTAMGVPLTKKQMKKARRAAALVSTVEPSMSVSKSSSTMSFVETVPMKQEAPLKVTSESKAVVDTEMPVVKAEMPVAKTEIPVVNAEIPAAKAEVLTPIAAAPAAKMESIVIPADVAARANGTVGTNQSGPSVAPALVITPSGLPVVLPAETVAVGSFAGAPKAVPNLTNEQAAAMAGQVVNGVLVEALGGVLIYRPARPKSADRSDFSTMLDLNYTKDFEFPWEGERGVAFSENQGKIMSQAHEMLYNVNLRMWGLYDVCMQNKAILGSDCTQPSMPRDREAFMANQGPTLGTSLALTPQKRMEREVSFLKSVESKSRKERVTAEEGRGWVYDLAIAFPMACVWGHLHGGTSSAPCNDKKWRHEGFGSGLYQCLMANVDSIADDAGSFPGTGQGKKCKNDFKNPVNNMTYKTMEACADEYRTYCYAFESTSVAGGIDQCLKYITMRGFPVSKSCNDTARERQVLMSGAIAATSVNRYPDGVALPDVSSLPDQAPVEDKYASVVRQMSAVFPTSCQSKYENGVLVQESTDCKDIAWGEGRYQCFSNIMTGPIVKTPGIPNSLGSCREKVYEMREQMKFLETCAADIKAICSGSEVASSKSKVCAAKVARQATTGSACQTVSYDYGVTKALDYGMKNPSSLVLEFHKGTISLDMMMSASAD